MRFLHWVFGDIQHIQIRSPELDRRLREASRSQINELTGLGFDYLCADGESFSIFRLFLIFPALVMIGVRAEGTPIVLQGGSIVGAYPLLIFKTKSTFAHIFGSRVKFYTAFRDGVLFVSGNYDDPLSRGSGILRSFQAGTISETWSRHLARIADLESSGALLDKQIGHETYVGMATRDNATW